MTMPGFNAEASLKSAAQAFVVQPAGEYYTQEMRPAPATAQVVPASRCYNLCVRLTGEPTICGLICGEVVI